MSSTSKRLSAQQLEDLGTRILRAAGASRARAQTVARHMMRANLTGHDSHGVQLLPLYCHLIEQGLLKPRATIRCVKQSSGMDVFDGGWCFGQVVAMTALEHGLQRARGRGAFSVAFRHSNHIGRLGHYAEISARQGFMTLIVASAIQGNLQSHPDSLRPLFGTNPICFAFQWRHELFLVDIATSVRAEGKVILHKNEGKRLPPGWLKDAAGRPTTDPNDLWTDPPGSLWPLGSDIAGYKGFGLALMADLLAGLCSAGGLAGSEAPKGANTGWMHFIDARRFTANAALDAVMEPWVRRLRTAQTVSGARSVTLPGDPEAHCAAERSARGVPIDTGIWRQLRALAKRLRVSLAELS